jgi:soluble lytic murein transglycosylase-like protein
MAAPPEAPRRRRPSGGALALIVAAVGAALIVLALALAAGRGGGTSESAQPLVPHSRAEGGSFGPLRYDRDHNATFERRAAAGFSQPLYAKSPGGVVATARRVARWRPGIKRAAAAAGIDADTLEAIVFLESAGDPNAMAGPDPRAASGLTQILPGTATALLGMHVNLPASIRITKQLVKAQRRARPALVAKLLLRRQRVDDRFNPAKALSGTARYLRQSRAHFPREDLAVEAYHMGIGNLQQVLSAFGGSDETPYAQLYFDSSPARHAPAYARLVALGDDSATYWFRVLAAKDILLLARTDPAALKRRADLQTQKNSAENLLHPRGQTTVFATPADLRRAEATHVVVPLDARRLARVGIRVDRRMGELAPRLGQRPGLYSALRPEALAVLAYIGAGVHALAGRGSLTVTSTVRDSRYQQLLLGRNLEATPNYSLHSTGYAFDIERRYTAPRQAYAFQFFLDRLQALNLIAWVREPGAIHITASRDAAALEPALHRLGLG